MICDICNKKTKRIKKFRGGENIRAEEIIDGKKIAAHEWSLCEECSKKYEIDTYGKPLRLITCERCNEGVHSVHIIKTDLLCYGCADDTGASLNDDQVTDKIFYHKNPRKPNTNIKDIIVIVSEE